MYSPEFAPKEKGWGGIAKTILNTDASSYERFLLSLKEGVRSMKKERSQDNLDFSGYEMERTRSASSYKQTPQGRMKSLKTIRQTEPDTPPSRRLLGGEDSFERAVNKRARKSKQRFSQLRR